MNKLNIVNKVALHTLYCNISPSAIIAHKITMQIETLNAEVVGEWERPGNAAFVG